MNEVEGIYSDQLGTNFTVYLEECSDCTSDNVTKLIDDQLTPHLNSSLERDFVYLSTGSDLYYWNATTQTKHYEVAGGATGSLIAIN